jgi:hypothetical protein
LHQAFLTPRNLLEVVAASFIVAYEAVCSECAAVEDELVTLARDGANLRVGQRLV